MDRSCLLESLAAGLLYMDPSFECLFLSFISLLLTRLLGFFWLHFSLIFFARLPFVQNRMLPKPSNKGEATKRILNKKWGRERRAGERRLALKLFSLGVSVKCSVRGGNSLSVYKVIIDKCSYL